MAEGGATINFNPLMVGIFCGEEIEFPDIHIQKFEDLCPEGISEKQKILLFKSTLGPLVYKEIISQGCKTYEEITTCIKTTYTSSVNPTILYNSFSELKKGDKTVTQFRREIDSMCTDIGHAGMNIPDDSHKCSVFIKGLNEKWRDHMHSKAIFVYAEAVKAAQWLESDEWAKSGGHERPHGHIAGSSTAPPRMVINIPKPKVKAEVNAQAVVATEEATGTAGAKSKKKKSKKKTEGEPANQNAVNSYPQNNRGGQRGRGGNNRGGNNRGGQQNNGGNGDQQNGVCYYCGKKRPFSTTMLQKSKRLWLYH